MNTEESIEFIKASKNHWWYVGRRAVVRKLLQSFITPSKSVVLEIGAGFGGMTDLLSGYTDKVDVMEPMDDCQESLNQITSIHHLYKSPEEIPCDNRYSSVFLFDVLEHIEDDDKTLKTIYTEYLEDGGTLLITVPAFQWLWTKHDTEHSHFRRYTRKELQQKLKSSGFALRYSSYAMTFLFPLVLLTRLFRIGGSGMDLPSRPINWILKRIFSSEALFIPRVSFPFGLSVVIVATKK